MFSFFICVTIVKLSMVNAMLDVDDLQLLFNSKHCIEASVVPLIPFQQNSAILDKDSTSTVEQLTVNVTETSKIKVGQSVTSRINELAQHNVIKYTYKLLSEEGPPHERIYKVTLILGDEKYEGSGSSLKKAQQDAAALALANTYYEHPPVKIKSDEEKSQTPTVTLNNIAMKLGLGVSYYLLNGKEEQEITGYGAGDNAYGKSKNYPKWNSSGSLRMPVEEPQVSGPFKVRVKVGESVFEGMAHTIQAARHDAAAKAIRDMEKRVLYKDNVCLNEESVDECKKKKESLKSPISRVHEAAQKRNLPVEFNIVEETGKSHQKVFITQCKLGDFITEGEGKSKKESKREAAEKMLHNLADLPEHFDENAIVSGFKNKKKRKKKKKQIMRNNINSVAETFGNVLSSIWSSGDATPVEDAHTIAQNKKTSSLKSDIKSAKDKLLEISHKLNIQVQFTDLSKHGDDFYSLTFLEVHPAHICLGKASTREKSHDAAALHGIKFLQKSGMLEKAGITEYKESVEFEDTYAQKDDIYSMFEELDKE
jgi:double-stranded RNA-binding protein Staufen